MNRVALIQDRAAARQRERAANFGLRRRSRDDSWRRVVSRVARKHGCEFEARASFDALTRRGVDEAEAAVSALLEWECVRIGEVIDG